MKKDGRDDFSKSWSWITFSLFFLFSIHHTNAQVLVECGPLAGKTIIVEYDLQGNLLNPSLISIPGTIEVYSQLSCLGNSLALSVQGSVSEYTLTNATATEVFSQEQGPDTTGMVLTENGLFFSIAGDEIGQYDLTSGKAINYHQLYNPPSQVSALAPLGNDLLISYVNPVNQASGTSVQVYDPSTQIVTQPSFISGLVNNSQLAVAVSATNIFVLNNSTISKYDLAGNIVSSNLISAPLGAPPEFLSDATSLAISGNTLYILFPSYGRVDEYDATTGNRLVYGVISGLTNPIAIAIASAASPQATDSPLMPLGGLVVIAGFLMYIASSSLRWKSISRS